MGAYRDQYASLFRGGREVVVIAVSTDVPEEQQSWARDEDYPFLFASDPEATVGKLYGAFEENAGRVIDNRTLFVIDPEGVITYRAMPFRALDPLAYEELGEAVRAVAGGAEEGEADLD